MRGLQFAFATALILAGTYLGVPAQQPEQQPSPSQMQVFGQPYAVPEIRVYLTDEETGEAFSNHDVLIKYYWTWDVIKETPETGRMSNVLDVTIKGRTDEAGMVIVPARVITPSRPVAPEGSELSEPRFQSVGITVNDKKHSCGLAIYDALVDLSDAPGEVHRTVMLYPRPKESPK